MSDDKEKILSRFSIALEQNCNEFEVPLTAAAIEELRSYYELLLKWNKRLHLVSPCSPEEFATRHVLESLFLVRHVRRHARVIDVGSGAGLPIIPCLIVRHDLNATLIESSQKKAVFLSEALRAAGLSDRATVVASRFEDVAAPESDYVTSRALDRFEEMLGQLIEWAPPDSTLLLYGGESLRQKTEKLLPAPHAEPIPQSERRFLIVCAARNLII